MRNLNTALVFANGQSCSARLVKKLLSFKPTVAILDSAINRLPKFIAPQYLFGDFDHAINHAALINKYPDLTIIHTPDQNKTDFEKAVEWLVSSDFTTIIIIWGTGKRADHTLANLVNLMKLKTRAHLFLLDDHSIIYPLTPIFKKYYKKNDIISLIPMPKAIGVTSHGLSYELHQVTLDMVGIIGNSNSAKEDGEVVISYQEGNLVLMESCDEPNPDWIFNSFSQLLEATNAQL